MTPQDTLTPLDLAHLRHIADALGGLEADPDRASFFSDVVVLCDVHVELERSLAAAQARVEKMGSAIEEYRAMWMICHENDPRPANSGDLTRIGQLRGRLFASTEE
jgi:hypothetical protein